MYYRHSWTKPIETNKDYVPRMNEYNCLNSFVQDCSTSQFSKCQIEALKTCFPGDIIHSSYNCQNKSMNLSPPELRSQKQLKFKFNHNWLFADFTYSKQTGIHWLVISEQTYGIFCMLCNKHATLNGLFQKKSPQPLMDGELQMHVGG